MWMERSKSRRGRRQTLLVTTSLLLVVAAPLPQTGAQGFAPPCDFCIRDEIQHLFRIQNHETFNDEQLIAETCGVIEFPDPVLKVSADGTQSSFIDVQRVVTGTCQSTLIEPFPLFIDDRRQIVTDPDPDVYGVLQVQLNTHDRVRFAYSHPTEPPPDGEKFRVVRVAIAYINSQNPAGPVTSTVIQIRVHRPPVLFTHGLWSDASGFKAMEDDFSSSHYEAPQLYRLDYSSTNDSHFTVNAPKIPDAIDALIQQGAGKGFAAGEVDLVGHSMGGILSRLYIEGPDYRNEVRRIVTSNTPHAGAQTANLLLDRSFDPLGLQCELISGLLSVTGFPQRGCYNGAVEDLQVTSQAIRIDLNNQGRHPSDVDVHAVATVFDVASLPPVTGPVQLPLPTLIARVVQICGTAAVAQIFNQDDHDFVVAATSQAGGLEEELTSLYPDLVHVGSVSAGSVIGAVKDLLQEPEGSSRFTNAGYTPDPQAYLSPSLCPAEMDGALAVGAEPRATAEGSGASAGEAALEIVSPAPGSAFAPGDSVTVESSSSAPVERLLFVLAQRADALLYAEATGPSASVVFEIPEDANGAMNLLVAGLEASGALVAVSDPTTLEVAVPAALDGIEVYPPTLYLKPCDTVSLELTGQYADGVARSLAAVGDLSFEFEVASAVRSGQRSVQLEQALDDTLTVSLGEVSSPPVTIRALPGEEPPGGVCAVPEPELGLAWAVALVALGWIRSRHTRS